MTKKQRSDAAKKAAETRRRKKAAKEAAMKQQQRPDFEKPEVEVTPYPRAGDNEQFFKTLDKAAGQAEAAKATREQATSSEAGQPEADEPQLLRDTDVAEWVAWPFMLWAQSQQMPSLLLSDREAASIAEPLTSIMNRHGVGDVLPPDAVDALRVGARITPVMTERFRQVKLEREKRKRAGGKGVSPETGSADKGQGGSGRPVQGVQRGQAYEPKEV